MQKSGGWQSENDVKTTMLKERKNMRMIPVLCMVMLSVPVVCFAQNNQTESLTITTYFPAPFGVFKNLKLSPSTESGAPELNQAGTMYFNGSELFVYNRIAGKWESTGLGGSGSSGQRIFSNNTVSPDQCSGTISSDPAYNQGQLCSVPWHQNITFQEPFSRPPYVIVSPGKVSDAHSPCARNWTDQWIFYPDNVTSYNFTLVASGSPVMDDDIPWACSSAANKTTINRWYTRAEASWIALERND